jgi:hypothetical protein
MVSITVKSLNLKSANPTRHTNRKSKPGPRPASATADAAADHTAESSRRADADMGGRPAHQESFSPSSASAETRSLTERIASYLFGTLRRGELAAPVSTKCP